MDYELTSIPQKLRKGVYYTITLSLSDYSAADGYTAGLILINNAGKQTLTATASGTSHLFTITSSTITLDAGDYKYFLYVTKSGEKYDVEDDYITIEPDLTAETTYDFRSATKKALDAVEAVLTGNASKEHLSLTLPNGVSVQNVPLPELRKIYKSLKRDYEAEKNAKNLEEGKTGRQRLKYQFVNKT